MKAHKSGDRFSRMINKVPSKAKKHHLRSLSKQRTSNTGRRPLKISGTKPRPKRKVATIQFRLTDTRSKNKKNKPMATKALTHPRSLKRATAGSVKNARIVRRSRIVRIMGQGQFTVDNKTLRELSKVDSSIVQVVNSDRPDDAEFKKRLAQLIYIVETTGKPLNPKEIIQSDIILPSVDLSVDDAKKLFKGEGVIPTI
jgi:ribosomal protein S25